MFRNIVIIVGIVVLAAVAFIAYGYLFGENETQTVTLEVSDDFVGKPIVDELERIRNLNIDGALFTKPSYQTLVDRTVEISPEPVGRDNPFASIGGGVASVVTVGASASSTRR